MHDTKPSISNTSESPAAPSTAILERDALAEAKDYNRREFHCDLADRALDLVYLAAAAFLFAVPLDRWLAQFPLFNASTVRLLALFAILTLGHMIVSFPLSWYSGHVLEHRYQMSRQTFGRWLWRYVKRNGLTLILGAATTAALYWIIWLSGPRWWLVAAGGYFALSILLGQLAPVLILPLFYRIERLQDQAMSERFGEISSGTGLSIEGVYRMVMSDETAKANAMLAGLGSTRRVLLGDTLLDGFTAEEVDVIFAHEVGHHVHHHVPKLIAAGLAYSIVGFLLCDLALRFWVGRVDGQLVYSQLPVYTLPCLTLVTTLFFMLVEPLQNAISRHFERQADTYALTRTGLTAAYRSAFVKLARLNKSDPCPDPLEVFLFHSHPPIAERLAMADRLLPNA
jgi:STE24 endopeptidase